MIRSGVMLAPCALLLAAQTTPPPDPLERSSQALSEGRYLDAVDGLAAIAFSADGKPREDAQDQAFSWWEQQMPMLTNEPDLAALDRQWPYSKADPALAARAGAAEPRD